MVRTHFQRIFPPPFPTSTRLPIFTFPIALVAVSFSVSRRDEERTMGGHPDGEVPMYVSRYSTSSLIPLYTLFILPESS